MNEPTNLDLPVQTAVLLPPHQKKGGGAPEKQTEGYSLLLHSARCYFNRQYHFYYYHCLALTDADVTVIS